MNIQTLSLSKVAGASVRATGFSSAQFKAATWRGDDLLVQMKNGEVLVLKGANAKRLSAPDFFVVFDDTSLPLASFAPGMDQPVANKAPHVPPFEVAAPVKVGKLPQGGNKAKGAASADDNPADEAWADQALASTNASANTAAPDVSVSTSSVPLADNASTASAASTTHTSADAAAAAPTTASLGSSLWGWPAVALGAGGAVALAQGGGSAAAADAAAKSAGTVSGVLVLGPVTNGKDLRVNVYDAKGNLLGSDAPNNDGSFTVSLDKAPATSVIRVEVAPVSGNTGGNDYIGEDGNSYDLLTPVSALTTFEAGKASTVNVTHYTDILARNLAPTGQIALSATELKAASTAFAKALGVTTTDTPIEQLRPKPTVDASGQPTDNPDLYGQLLKTVFEQVKAAQATATTTNEKTNAVAETLNTLAQAITIDLPTSTSSATTASVSVEPTLGKVVLAAKVADYVANSDTSAAVSSAPTLDDYKAAGFNDVSNAEQANAALANAVKSATSGNSGTTATPLLDVVQQQLATNKAPTAVTLTTVLSEIAEITTGGKAPLTKVADIAVTDDGLGTNALTLAGADKDSFELQGNALYLKAGTTLDFEAKKTYAVTVQAADAALTSSSPVSADFTLNVTNVNEAPTATGSVSPVTAFKDTPITEIDLSTQFSDVDVGDTRTYSLSTGSVLPEGLSLDTRTGKISGTPTATTSGTSSITVVATDTGGLTAKQTFSLTVNAINHAPTATDGSVAAKEDSPYVLKAADFGFKDATGETGELLNVILTALPEKGSLLLDGKAVTLTDGKAVVSKADIDAGKLTFQAAANQHAVSYATLSFKVQDNGGTVGTGAADTSASTNTLTFNVASVNDAPTGTDGSVAATEDVAYVLKAADFGFKDAESETDVLLNVILTALPEKGSLLLDGKAVTLTDGKAVVSKADIDAGKLTFQAAPNTNGDGYATLSFKVQDSGGTDNGGADTSASANTLTFNVAAVNDAPTAKGTVSAVAVTAGTAITAIDLSSKFEDVDTSDTLTYTVTGGTLPSGLSLTDGKITGTPDTPTSGTSHITVTATDRSDAKATQTFDLTVLRPVSVDKVAGDDVINLAEKNASAALTGMAVAGSTVTITLPDGTTQRTTRADGTGAWTYTLTDADYTALGQGTGKTVSVSSYDPVTKVTSPTVTHTFGIDTVVPVFDVPSLSYSSPISSLATTPTVITTVGRVADLNLSSIQVSPVITDFGAPGNLSHGNVQSLTANSATIYFPFWGSYNFVVSLSDADNGISVDEFYMLYSRGNVVTLNSFQANFNPIAPLTLETDAGSSSTDLITNNGKIKVKALEAGATWKYKVDSADYQEGGSDKSFTVTGDGEHTVKLQQFDAAGNPSEVESLTFTLDTTPPTFTDGDAKTVSVAENTAIATAVLTASATDKGAAVTQYAFAGGDDDDKFDLDAATGKLTFKASPDFEAPSSKAGSNAYTVKIKAVDTAGNSAVQTITVNVTDVNDGPKPVPVLTQVSDDVGPVQGDVAALQVTRIASPAMTSLENRVTITPTVSGNMTVEGWFKTDSPTSSTTQQLFFLDGMELQVINGTLRTWASSDGNQTVSSFTVDNQWHHYALTTDGAGHWQVWVDGVLKQERAGGSIGATPAAQTIYVGGHAGDGTNGLRGTVSQVQVWDSQRTATEIAADMHDTYTGGKNSAGETPANLVGVWALAGNGDNQVSGGVSATLGTATRSEAASIQFLFNYQTDDATPTLSGTLNVALGAGERLVLLDGDTEVPATVTADGLNWHLVPKSPLDPGVHNLVVKVKLADDTYSTSPTLAQETYHVTVAAPLTHPATFTGDTSGSVTEDAATNTVNGTLTVSDADADQNGFQAVAEVDLQKTYGSFTFDTSNGKWAYTLDNDKPETQALTSADSKEETLTVKSTDGTTQNITVTVHGANEATSSAPIVTGGDAGSGGSFSARYILIGRVSNGGNWFKLSEVEVFSDGVNVAQASGTSATAFANNANAGLAKDGDGTNEWMSEGAGAAGSLQWWQLDLGQVMRIDQIKFKGSTENPETDSNNLTILAAQSSLSGYTTLAAAKAAAAVLVADTGANTVGEVKSYDIPAVTTDTTPILSGTLDAALSGTQVLRVFDTSTTEPTDLGLAAVTTTDGKTTWSLTVADAKALSQGTHTLVARVMSSDAADAAVLTAGSSTTVKVIDLSITPSLATVTDDVATQGSASGDVAVSDFKVTDDTTPTLSGSYAGTLADGQVIQILDGDTVIGTATPGTASGGATPWTFTPATPLAAGAHSLKAQVSVNGLAGTASEAATFTVQSVDRASVATDDGSSVTQAALSLGTVSTTPTTLTGGKGDLSLLTAASISALLEGLACNASDLTQQSDGTYTVWIRRDIRVAVYSEQLQLGRDDAGNIWVKDLGGWYRDSGGASFAKHYIITNLALTGITPYTTTDTTPVLSGTLGTELATGEVVKVYDTSTPTPTELGQATVTTTDGKTTWSLTLGSALSGGEHTIVAKVMSSSDTSATVVAAGSGTALWIKSPATFGGDTSGSVTEDSGSYTVNGTLTVSDTDDGEAGFQTPTSLSGTYGSFTFDSSNGKWTYTLDNDKPETQALTSAASKEETLTVKSTDGTTQNITVTVHGADEASAPVIPPPPVIDTTVPAWISASPYVVASTKEAFKALTPQQQGMASLISDDVIAAGGEPTPANQSSWLGMNDDGTRKTWQSGDEPLTLTYAFENSGASYTTTAGEQQTQQSFDEPEKSFISSVFKRFADVVNVQFTEITDSATSQNYKVDGGADLRMFKGTKDEYGVGDTTMGFAYLPTSEDAQHPTDKLADSEGDFFLVTNSNAYPQTNPFSSAYGVEKSTVTHELGHAMGLNHPFANDAYSSHWYGDTTGTAANRLGDMTGGSYDAVTSDAPQETIMTYLSPFGDLIPSLYAATTPGYAPIATERYAPIDLGVYDIAALQHLYGANMSHATGNDVYKYSSDTPVFATIWDAGGHDTLQQEGNQDAVIDLRGGDHMSRMGLFTSYSATFSKSALENALDGTISDWYGVYTDGDGQEHRVGHVTHAGDAYTYYADPSMPANTTVAIKVDYSQDGGSTTLSADIGDLDNVGVPDASMAYNIGIAFGVVIEDAIGGDGNDVIWGNAAANTITTGAGKDVVEYDTAANINGDTILDFSADDKINLTALGLSSTDSLNWDSGTHKLSYVDTSIPANSWALTIQGVFNKQSQLVIHA